LVVFSLFPLKPRPTNQAKRRERARELFPSLFLHSSSSSACRKGEERLTRATSLRSRHFAMADGNNNSSKPGAAAAAASSSAGPMPLKKRPLSNAAPAPRPAVRPRADEVRPCYTRRALCAGVFAPAKGRGRDARMEREREREKRVVSFEASVGLSVSHLSRRSILRLRFQIHAHPSTVSRRRQARGSHGGPRGRRADQVGVFFQRGTGAGERKERALLQFRFSETANGSIFSSAREMREGERESKKERARW